MNELVKEINTLLLNNSEVKEYLRLKNEIENDEKLTFIKSKLEDMRKKICKNKEDDSSEYYELLDVYKNDARVRKYEQLQRVIKEGLVEISDILSLK